MWRTLVLFLALASCLSASPQKALTNDDVIKMVKAGLSDDVILLAIESQRANFDISAQALIELKQQGASKAVIDKILEVTAASQRAVAPPSQAQPQVDANAAGPALSAADALRLRTVAEQAFRQSRHLQAQPMKQSLHELLDQGLSGRNLPAPFKASWETLFAPHRQAFHQFLDEEAPRLRQQLYTPSQPRSKLRRPSSFVRPVLWTGGKAFTNEVRRDPMVGLRWRSSLRPYHDPSLWLLNAQPACGEKRASHSESIGDATETITVVTWLDTPNSIASTGDAVMEMDITANPKVPVQGTKSGKLSSKIMNGACVDRCPTADGKVAGKSESGLDATVEVTAETGVVTGGRQVFQEDVTAEGHVGDDARLSEVVVQVDAISQQPVGSAVTIVRWQGTATFNPHGSEADVPLQLTGCSVNQGAVSVAQCSPFGTVHVSTLQDTYQRAERKWNLEQESGTGYEPGSRCIIAKFTPPTDTVQGSPGQRVPVKAELIAVRGNRPTWGVFKELNPIPTGDGDIQANGTPTSPDAPAQLTYTAPSKQWPCNDPPGFGVYRATSRAGALDPGDNGVGYKHDDWSWFLAPGCLRLSIHERGEANVMGSSYLSEVTFPMDLTVNEKHQVMGLAVVPREGRSRTMQGLCEGVEHWNEQWHASGTLDEKTDTLTLKLWFEASPKQGVNTCKVGPVVGSDEGPVGASEAPMKSSYTVPGFRSDAFPSPLNQFTLADKVGATQHFVIPLGPAKHTIDVTLQTEQGTGAAK